MYIYFPVCYTTALNNRGMFLSSIIIIAVIVEDVHTVYTVTISVL